MCTSGKKYPCGKCAECSAHRRNEWSLRITMDIANCNSIGNTAYFVTLTYDTVNVPSNNTLVKKDLQLFIKRLRKFFSDNEISHLRYFGCGEYGSKTLRPHYHLILYNIPKSIEKGTFEVIVLDKWKKGFVTVEPVTSARIHYVTKYVLKNSKHFNLPFELSLLL